MPATTARRSARALAAVVAALMLGACGTEVVDQADLEGKLARQLGASAGVQPKSVSCPDGVEKKEGQRFACTLIAPNDDQVPVEVRLTNGGDGFEAMVPNQ